VGFLAPHNPHTVAAKAIGIRRRPYPTQAVKILQPSRLPRWYLWMDEEMSGHPNHLQMVGDETHQLSRA